MTKSISIEEIQEKIALKQGYWIDVREEDEVMEGTLEGSFWIPLSLLCNAKNKDDLLFKSITALIHANKTALLYCRSGGRSNVAMSIFNSFGIAAENAGGFSELAQHSFAVIIPAACAAGDVAR